MATEVTQERGQMDNEVAYEMVLALLEYVSIAMH